MLKPLITIKGTGTQPQNIYALRDFEKCNLFGRNHSISCKVCKGTGYKIPFKDYEIKKVSEIVDFIIPTRNNKDGTVNIEDHNYNQKIRDFLKNLKDLNLKEDDKVVITNSR